MGNIETTAKFSRIDDNYSFVFCDLFVFRCLFTITTSFIVKKMFIEMDLMESKL